MMDWREKFSGGDSSIIKTKLPKRGEIGMDKILVVEDNMELSDTLCRSLQAEGFTPYAA